MPDTLIILGTVVALALAFDFINGFHDTANAIATSVLTQALSIRNAILLSASANFIGALVWTGVAKAVGKGIVDTNAVEGDQVLVISALIGAIIWNLLTWYKGLPSSSSHAIIGGLVGAAIVRSGYQTLNFSYAGLGHIFLWLVISPILGFFVGIIAMSLVAHLFQHRAPYKLNRWFLRLQAISAGFMAFSHGANDAQKSMGVITLAMVNLGYMSAGDFAVPTWVKVSCATAMALGTAAGGWRIIKTVGRKVIGLQPVHGCAAETSAAIVITAATHFHAPVYTTHVISSAVMGVGAAKSLKGVRWGIIKQIVAAWLMTLPVAAMLGGIAYAVLHYVVHL